MIRLDSRGTPDDGLIINLKKGQWERKDSFKTTVTLTDNKAKVEINWNAGAFHFLINGVSKDLLSKRWDFDPTRPVGFLNELNTAYLTNFKVR